MTKKKLQNQAGFDFSKRNKVSIWASTTDYATIPDSYFEERFSRGGLRANNQWSDQFKLRFFYPEEMETNGVESGLVAIDKAVGECSFSSAFIKPLLNKAKQKDLAMVSWVILVFDMEYSVKATGVESDDYVTFVGAFTYDELADSVIEIEEEKNAPGE